MLFNHFHSNYYHVKNSDLQKSHYYFAADIFKPEISTLLHTCYCQIAHLWPYYPPEGRHHSTYLVYTYSVFEITSLHATTPAIFAHNYNHHWLKVCAGLKAISSLYSTRSNQGFFASGSLKLKLFSEQEEIKLDFSHRYVLVLR